MATTASPLDSLPLGKRELIVLLALLIAVPGALSTWLTHPFGLSQYSALAGGPAGGGADTVPQQGRTATSYLVMSGSREINANSLDSVLGSPSAQRPAPGVQSSSP